MTAPRQRKLSDTRHPLWRLLTICVLLSFLTLFLYLNASHFDESEIKSILYMGLAAGGWETFKHKVSSRNEE